MVPQRVEDPGSDPFVTPRPQGGVRDLVLEDRFDADPRATGDQPDEDPPEAQPVRDPGPMTAQRMGLGRGGIRASTAVQTASNTSGSSARMMWGPPLGRRCWGAPESHLGHHGDRWMVTYPRGPLNVSSSTRRPPGRGQARLFSTHLRTRYKPRPAGWKPSPMSVPPRAGRLRGDPKTVLTRRARSSPLACLRLPKRLGAPRGTSSRGPPALSDAENRPRSGMSDRNLAGGEQGTAMDELQCRDQVIVDRRKPFRRSSLGAVTTTLIPRWVQLRTAAVSSASASAKRGTVPKPIYASALSRSPCSSKVVGRIGHSTFAPGESFCKNRGQGFTGAW